jgi:membrane protease YdiL (CAAX protease family)
MSDASNNKVEALPKKQSGIKYIFLSIVFGLAFPISYSTYNSAAISAGIYDSILDGSIQSTDPAEIMNSVLSDGSFLLTMQLLFWAGLLMGPIFAAIFGKYKFLGKEGMFALGFKVKWIFLGLLFGIVAQAVSLGIGYLVQQAYPKEDVTGNGAAIVEAFSGVSPLLVFLVIAIGAPIVEEIFYRGLVFTALANKFGLVAGGIVSSLLFGISHYSDSSINGIFGILLTAALGGVLAFARFKSGGIFLPIMIHIGFNSVAASALLALSYLS